MRVVQMNAFDAPKPARPVNTVAVAENKKTQAPSIDIRKLLDNFEKDDYILAGLLIVLMLEGCDDYILLAALGYLFIMGIV